MSPIPPPGKEEQKLVKQKQKKNGNNTKSRFSAGQFLQDLTNAKKKNAKTTDQLDNFQFGFDVNKKISNKLASAEATELQTPEQGVFNFDDSSVEYVYIDSLSPFIASKTDTRSVREKKRKRKTVRVETETQNVVRPKAMRIDENQSGEQSNVDISRREENFDDFVQPQSQLGNVISTSNWNTVPTEDENGNAVAVSPWKATPGTFGEHYFNAGIFQLVAKSKENTKCLVRCTACPKEKNTFFVAISSNSNLTRHLKTVRSFSIFDFSFFF